MLGEGARHGLFFALHMPLTHSAQAPGPGRYWALLNQWVGSMKDWADDSKVLIAHDNAESVLSEPEAQKVR